MLVVNNLTKEEILRNSQLSTVLGAYATTEPPADMRKCNKRELLTQLGARGGT